jgi:2-succinyl-5-enolpyruvyl-6-hydroxy-3-cyclohexene-1-carboxylate synthase
MLTGVNPSVNPSTALALVVVDELIAGGVRDAVLSPGSRNAPLAFALHAADAAGRLRLHVRIDERGAGFLAVGLAARSARPVPVVCTSGTAAANLHPAMLEAHHSGVPLLALTADRPAELYGTGANQTIEQAGLFGGAARAAFTLQATGGAGDNGPWRSTVCRALAAASGAFDGDPGPVHLNVALRPPLVPSDITAPLPPEFAGRRYGRPWTTFPAPAVAPLAADLAVGPTAATSTAATSTAATSAADPTVDPAVGPPAGPAAGAAVEAPDSAQVGMALVRERRGGLTLVVAGQGSPPVPEWVRRLPRVAEPGSPLWAGSLTAGPWLLGALAGAGLQRPDRVIVVGRPTLHRAVQGLLADPAVEVVVLADRPQWTDVAGTAHTVVTALPERPAQDGLLSGYWARAMAAADRTAATAVAAVLDEEPWPIGPAVARDVVAALPPGALLALGSSNPIRDVALAAVPRADVTVHVNRGVAGIDGMVSTAVGATLAHPGPGYALLGDLTFLHDSTGLVIGQDEPRPDLTIVVFNDDGGGIFSLLEQGAPEHAAAFERVFGTPHGVRLAELCAASGVRHARVTSRAELTDAVAAAPRGLAVVEVLATRAGLRDLHARLRAGVGAALATKDRQKD